MFRNPLRGGANRPVLPPALANQMRLANQLLSEGQPAKAALLFTQLADQTTALGRPRQAGNMHARAAHAWLSAGDQTRALAHARQALTTFINMGMMQRAVRFKTNFTHHLQEMKLEAVAQAFIKETDLPIQPGAAGGTVAHGQLPTTCPQCGAPLRSDSVDWIDAQSAECDSCGSVVNTI
jgi:hypothetical protein